ncbi:MAG: hypothetical protein WCC90_08360 [Methylocella sp.]
MAGAPSRRVERRQRFDLECCGDSFTLCIAHRAGDTVYIDALLATFGDAALLVCGSSPSRPPALISRAVSQFRSRRAASAPKPVANHPIVVDIERQVAGQVRLYGLPHYRKRCRPADKLPLAFRQKLGTAKVIRHYLDKVAEPTGRLGPAVKTLDGKETGTVAHAAPMRALIGRYRRDICCGFHAIKVAHGLPQKSRHPPRYEHNID